MTNAVAATSTAATTAETQRTQANRSNGASYAQFQAAAAKDSDTTKSSDSKTASGDAPKGERTQAVKGHSYKEIVSGPRNGMFINNTGNKRDGEAFLIVKRHGREFHIYGSGDARKVYEVGRKRETADAKDTSGTADTTKTTDTSATSGTTGATTTPTTGSGTTTS